MFATTTTIPIDDDDSIFSRIGRCLDGRAKDIGGIPHINSLLLYTQTSRGKSELNYILNANVDQVTAFVAAILYCSNHDEIKKRFDFLLPDNTKCPVSLNEEHLLLMESFLFSRKPQPLLLSSYYSRNRNKKKGWIKNSWFCENKNYERKKKASISDRKEYENFILHLHICMLKGEDKYNEQEIANAWNLSPRSVRGKREIIQKQFQSRDISNSKQRRAPPLYDISSPAVRRVESRRRKSFIVSPTKQSPGKFIWGMISSPQKKNQPKTKQSSGGSDNIRSRLLAPPTKRNNNIYDDNDNDRGGRIRGGGGSGCGSDFDDYGDSDKNTAMDFSFIENDDDDSTNHSLKLPVRSRNYGIPLAAPSILTPIEINIPDDFITSNCRRPLYINTTNNIPSNIPSMMITPTDEPIVPLFKSKSRYKNKKRPPMSQETYPLLSSIFKSKEVDDDVLLEEVLSYYGKDCIMNRIFDASPLPSKKNEARSIDIRRPNGAIVSMHQVTKSCDYVRYKANATRTKWLIKILESAGTVNSIEEVVGWTIVYLGNSFPEALRWAGKELKLPFLKERMDVISAASMWKEANTTLTGQRVIRQHLFCHYGVWITSPEKHIRKLTEHFVRPTLGQATVDDVCITYWTKSLLEVVKNLFQYEWKDIVFDELHVVLGGDHGCGVFSAPIKCIAFSSDGKVIKNAIEKIGHIDCRKDTYDVLKQTIGPIMNDFMKEIYGKFICIPNDETGVSLESDRIKDNCKYHKLELFAIGDLQFAHTALGKVSMDRMWCHLCNLSNTQWAELVHTPGRPWTLMLMEKMRERTVIEKLTGAERKGVVMPPIFDALEPSRWLIPMLHVMMGQFNHAFENAVMRYVDNRHETVTSAEIDARDTYWKCLIKIEDKKKLFDVQAAYRKDDTDDINELIKEIEEQKKKQHPIDSDEWKKRRSKFSNAEKKEMSKQIAEHKKKIQQLDDIEKEERSLIISFEEEAKVKLYDLKALENLKGRKASGRVRNKIDRCLRMYGIDRAAFHGGDFTGVDCLELENNIEPLFEDIKKILIDNPESEVLDDEVHEIFESFELHFLITSHMVSLTRTPKYIMKDPVKKAAVLDQLREVIPLINKSIKRLHLSMKTPKRHYVSDHIVHMMDAYDGIAEYYEDWVEQAHQTYRKCTTRGKIRDKAGASFYYCRQEKLYQNEDIALKAASVKQERTRTFTTNREPVKGEREKELRKERRKNAVERFKVLYASTPELPTNLQLNLIDCRGDDDSIEDGGDGGDY